MHMTNPPRDFTSIPTVMESLNIYPTVPVFVVPEPNTYSKTERLFIRPSPSMIEQGNRNDDY